MTVNDGSNDDDNNDNNDDHEAIWESLDSDAAVVLLCASARAARTKCTFACRALAAVPDGDWFCRTCQPSASAKAVARVLAATEQVHEADIERTNEVENARGRDDDEDDDTDEDQVRL